MLIFVPHNIAVVVSEDEDDNDDGRGDEFPDDGMGPVLASGQQATYSALALS